MRNIIIYIIILLANLYFFKPLNAVELDSKKVQMHIKNLFIDSGSETPVVILENKIQKKYIPIWIGKSEASSIAIQLEQVDTPRPNSHDLIRNIINRLGAKLDNITITDLRENTYFAVITLGLSGNKIQIDSRPSDAIAIALRMKAPILATSRVLSKSQKFPSQFKVKGGPRNILGFYAQELSTELAKLFKVQAGDGILVADVEVSSTASKAGIQRGDIITRINDKAITNIDQLDSFIVDSEKKGQIKIEIEREGKSIIIEVNLSLTTDTSRRIQNLP